MSCLVLACAMAALSRDATRASVLAGVGFAVPYAGFVTAVHFIRLTAVLHGSAAPEILAQLSCSAVGSRAFNPELPGCGLMTMSTVFAGLAVTVTGRRDRWRRGLLIGHGLFAPTRWGWPACISAPFQPEHPHDRRHAIGTCRARRPTLPLPSAKGWMQFIR